MHAQLLKAKAAKAPAPGEAPPARREEEEEETFFGTEL